MALRWLASRPPAVLVACAAALAYAPTLAWGFVFDDQSLLAGNPFFRDAANLWRLAGPGYFDSGELTWRPVATLSHLLEALATGEPHAATGHAVNTVLHALAAGFAAAVASRCGASRAWALAIGLTIAWHPGPSEAVAVVANREDPLMLALAGAAVLAAVRAAADPARRPAWIVASLAAGAAALGSKETAVLLPVVVWACSRRVGASGRLPAGLAAGHAVLGIAYALLRFGPMRHPDEAANAFPLPPGLAPRLATTIRVLGEDLGLLAVPWRLSADPWPAPVASVLDGRLVWPVLVIAAVAFAAVLSRTRRGVAPGLVLLLLALAPTLPLAGQANLRADRYGYAALPGLGLALAGTLAWLAARGPRARPAAVGAAVALAGLALIRLELRLPAFRDEATLWRVTLAEDPTSVRARLNAAGEAFTAGDPARGVAWLDEALALAPTHPLPPLRAGLLLGDRALRDPAGPWRARAIAHLHEAAARAPTWWRPHDALGVLATEGDPAAARAAFAEAIRLAPRAPSPRVHLGHLALAQGDLDAAARAFAEAEGLPGGGGPGAHGRGLVALRREAWREAADAFVAALVHEPGHPDALAHLGALRRREGRLEEARALLEFARTTGRPRVDVLWNLAGVRESAGDLAGALECLDRCAELAGAPAGLAARREALRARIAGG